MIAVPGTSLDESLRTGREVTAALLKLPFVRTVAQRVGRAELSDDTWGPHYSELEIDLKPMGGEQQEAAQGELRKTLMQFSGLSFSLYTFLSERIQETLPGYTASVVANVYAPRLPRPPRAPPPPPPTPPRNPP